MINGKKILGVIPARYGSTRIPAKLLADICGRPLVYYTYEAVRKASVLDTILVATDDRRIFDAVEAFGGEVVMTSEEHRSGTDRIAEVARYLPYQCIINVQADEPEIDPRAVDKIVLMLKNNSRIDIATLAVPLEKKHLADRNKVKVFFNRKKMAFAFVRTPNQLKYFKTKSQSNSIPYRHIGIYGYRKTSLLKFVKLPQANIEKELQLEQLRALVNGLKIKIIVPRSLLQGYGIDTPGDYKNFVKRYLKSVPKADPRGRERK